MTSQRMAPTISPPESTPVSSWGWMLVSSAAALACSEPALDDAAYRCTRHADCGPQETCAPVGEQLACRPREEVPLRIGMSGPLQGPSQDLGIEMRRGIEAQFRRVNEGGGVHGRPLALISVNDNYDPVEAVAMTQELLDVQVVMPGNNEPDIRGPNGVFALLGNIGTPTMLETARIANKNEVLFFAPFTGAQTYLRDGTNSPYVYNFRAGYYDETEAIIDYIASDRIPRIIVNPEEDHRRILIFAQNDSYGEAGYRGVVRAYNRRINPLVSDDIIQRISYEREDVASVDPAIAQARLYMQRLLEGPEQQQSAAIVMVDTYQPGNRMIRMLKDWINEDAERARRLDILFINVSFVGSDSLIEALTTTPESYQSILNPSVQLSYAEGVMVTQVVPDYNSELPAVADYRADIDNYDDAGYSFTSLEGYLVARLFVTALELNGSNFTTNNVRNTLDSQIRDRDIGIGTRLHFDATDHQASNTVWGTRIGADGNFHVPFIWNPEERIRSN